MVAEQLTQPVARPAIRVRDHAAARKALVFSAGFIVFRAVGGNFANQWEDWGLALSNGAVAVVEGLIGIGLVFGLLVRFGLAAGPRNRPATFALVGGILALASWIVIWLGLPAIIGAGTMALGLEGARRARAGDPGRGVAKAGIVLAGLTLTAVVGLYVGTLVVGIFKYWI